MASCVSDPSRDCILMARVEQIEKQIERYRESASQTHKEMFDRIRQLEDDRTEVKTHYQHIEDAIETIKRDIAEIKAKPGRRWDGAVDKVIFALIGAVVAYVMTQVGF